MGPFVPKLPIRGAFASFTHKKDEIIAGSYTLNTDMDYRALLAGMSANSSNRSEVTVTIPEGYNTDQIFALLEEKGVCTVEKLREAAALRIAHPEDTLAQLAERCDPPVTKSALNHRLRKLMELGESGRRK